MLRVLRVHAVHPGASPGGCEWRGMHPAATPPLLLLLLQICRRHLSRHLLWEQA